MIQQDTWLGKTHQGWKMNVFILLVVIEIVVFALFVWRVNSLEKSMEFIWLMDELILAAGFLAVGACAFGFIFFSIRCPTCRKNVGWHVINTLAASVWFATMLALDRCPHCGSLGSEGEQAR